MLVFNSRGTIRGIKIWLTQVLLLVVPLALAQSHLEELETLTETTFISRCKAAGDIPSPGVTCESLWESFARTFQCPAADCTPVTDKSKYAEFINIIPPITAVNKTLFYSKTKTVAANIGRNCVHKNTIETTFFGRIFDEGVWCCARDGVMDTTCSKDPSCTNQVLTLFWTSASEVFAGAAKGYPATVLNGSSDTPPYREDSIFTTTEVPSLTSDVVSLTVILAYDDGGRHGRRWKCDSPDSRLDDLHKDLDQKGIKYNCTDALWFSSQECSGAWTTVPCHWYIAWLILSLWTIVSEF